MKTKILTDINAVNTTMVPRSIEDPRTHASPKARTKAISVSMMSKGAINVSEAGKRVAKISATDSPVVQLLPKLNVATCLTKIHSCTASG